MERILSEYPEDRHEAIKTAWELCRHACGDRKRENGALLSTHPLSVARIVACELGLDADAVTASFVHEALRFDPSCEAEIEKKFSAPVMRMARDLCRISSIKVQDTRLEADNYKKLIINYSHDPRTALIKLCDRLEVMRNIGNFSKGAADRKCAETFLLYIPIAHQLGLYRIKAELEEITFRSTDPENWRLVTNKLKATAKEREAVTKSFITPLKARLDAEGIKYSFKARTKSASSIWKKMCVQGVPFEKVYDVNAIRIIIDCPQEQEKDLCWKVYSIVTENYEADTKRLRDWITVPKPNGYQSLHTTVKVGPETYVEAQIRSERMDAIAENGFASHWSYKGISASDVDGWLLRVREALESSQPVEYKDLEQFVNSEVFVFTPDGNLIRLKAGATVLDFAFAIHSGLGVHCCGATIDGRAVSIREKLKTGQIVHVQTRSNQKPNEDWLNYVISRKARSKIRQCLKEQEIGRAEIGKEMLQRRIRNWKYEFSEQVYTYLTKKFKYPTATSFFAAVADEDVSMVQIKEAMTRYNVAQQRALSETSAEYIPKGEVRYSNEVRFEGLPAKSEYRLAKCCTPIPGDEIFGFLSSKSGLTVHRMSCPNAARLLDTFPHRVVRAHWVEL
ncbi:MAG: bifunctional (p)ppGpp synthetase/guanosine-3',5'-bis(diphosphate) 3'-pyrophosphohydrolase [Bacteroidales bacterium]|nr:bifunctional (p)ppGpp synthetase/guanosine-3',5'-bis(diphosphate) 3'-pyrophosphohydrolase [Bacteroidales bacterium]